MATTMESLPTMDTLVFRIKLLLFSWFHLKSRPVSLLKCFSYKDIKMATNNFHRTVDNSLNGTAYIAKFKNGHVGLVKEIRAFSNQDDVFHKEVQILVQLHHRHVIALSGFCAETKRFLVFKNIENGSLREHLNDPLKTPLNWRTRLQIATGVAAALEYLLFFCDPPLYHVSISSSTIMLDENFTAKLSDVGLLHSGRNHDALSPTSCSKECMDQACGNIVFQLGLLILELITGQSSEKGGTGLVHWLLESNLPTSIYNMIDPDLGNNYDARELRGLLAVARLCIKSVGRPTSFVPQILWYIQKKVVIP